MSSLALLKHRVESSTRSVIHLSHKITADKADQALLTHRIQATNTLDMTLLHRTDSPGPEVMPGGPMPDPPVGSSRPPGTLYPGLSEWDLAWMIGKGTLESDIYGGINAGTDISGIPYRVEVTHGRSQASTWNMFTVDSTGQFHPFKVGGAYEGVFGFTKNHKMRARFKWGGRTFDYSGFAQGFSHQRTNRDGGWFRDSVWSGTDESRPLFKPSKTMKTVRSTRLRTARKVPTAQEIVAAAGLSISGLKDGPIRLFHRQKGKYGDLLARLVEMDGQEWHMVGKQVRAYDSWKGEGAGYQYGANIPVRSEGYESSIFDVLTRVQVRRLNEADNGGAPDEPEVAIKFGTYTKTFEVPLSNVQWQCPVQTLGVFSDFIFRNAAGNVIAVRNPRAGIIWASFLLGAPIINAVSVEYTFGAMPGVVAGEGYGEIVFTGTSSDQPNQEDLPDEYESSFDVPVIDEELEDLFDEILEEMDTNEQIATEAQAVSFGRGYLNRLKAALFPLSITVPLNPAIVDGTPITIIDQVLGLTHRRPCISAVHSFSDDPAQRWTRFVIGGYLGQGVS